MPPRPAQPRPADHLRLVTPAPAAGAAPKGLGAKALGGKALGGKALGGKALGGKTAAAKSLGARAAGDWAWHGLGIGVATASAGFATYALVFSTGEVVPSGNFNVFARYDHIYQAPAARRGEPVDTATAAAPEAVPPSRADVAKADTVDFTPTGSLAGGADGAQAGAGGEGRAAPASRLLPNFKLRDVFDGKALVESRSSLSVVKPGSVLDGAGQVLSIEKRGEQWVVLTQNGLIAGQRR